MKKYLRKKLRYWLFPDIAELANYQIKNLKVDELPSFKGRKEFLISAHKVRNEPAFQTVIRELLEQQIEHSVMTAENWERVLFHRATINGFSLIEEEFERLDNEYTQMIQPIETFNNQDIL